MRTSLMVIIYLMMVGANSETVDRNKGDPVNNKCANAPVWQKLRVGDSVTINCTYTREGESAIKQFCREDRDSQCTNVISTHVSNCTQLGRFTLTDYKQKGVYTVVITALNQEDNGIYWCAVEKTLTGNTLTCLSRIHLHIRNRDDVTQQVKHQTGSTALITCSYPPNHTDNTKSLCKGENPFDCLELINTTHVSGMSEGRFHIRDNKRKNHFNVHIKNVMTADAGTYWCISDRKCHNNGCKEIHLSMEENQAKNKRWTTQWTTQWTTAATSLHVDRSSHSGMTWVLILCLAVVIVIVVVVIVLLMYRHNCLRTQGKGESSNVGINTEENHGDPTYEEIQEVNQQGSGSGGALLSVYACAGSPPADQLHYASISFQEVSVTVSTDRNAHSDKNGSLVCVYSSVNTEP
ncbi:CMRF35-like molecule 1 [Solea solea]|uniref:CMRF35-like molecule 1 n=1 Tax=Solea solea TaxID=90069 RepID=UPI00272BE98A|nr:CMRF35-like molecule 1 [Solea solea]